MTVYQPGPYLLDFPAVQTGLTHHTTFNCDAVGDPAIGTIPSAITLRSKDGSGVHLEDAANEIWDVIAPFFSTTHLTSEFVLWKYNGTNLDKTFISGGTLVAPNGANPGPAVLSNQIVMTYRSGGGHVGKVSLMETVYAGVSKTPLGNVALIPAADFKAYLLGPTDVIMARDRSFPVAGLNQLIGENEKTFKRRNRQ